MNIIEIIHDFICWVNDLITNHNDDYIANAFMKKEDIANYEEEIKDLLDRKIMTKEDLEILEQKLGRISIELRRLVLRAEKYHWSIEKTDSQLRILLTKYKFSKSYINYFTNEFMESYKQEH